MSRVAPLKIPMGSKMGGRSEGDGEGASDSKGVIGHDHVRQQHQKERDYEGESLARLLQSIQRKIEWARLVDGNALPEKIWFKQQFSIGVNEVTRVLERTKPIADAEHEQPQPQPHFRKSTAAGVHLQAVLVASDSSPRWLTKHLASLALSRKVPLIFLKDEKQASLRLGQLFKLKTAIAIGIKAKGNCINQLFLEILSNGGTK